MLSSGVVVGVLWTGIPAVKSFLSDLHFSASVSAPGMFNLPVSQRHNCSGNDPKLRV